MLIPFVKWVPIREKTCAHFGSNTARNYMLNLIIEGGKQFKMFWWQLIELQLLQEMEKTSILILWFSHIKEHIARQLFLAPLPPKKSPIRQRSLFITNSFKLFPWAWLIILVCTEQSSTPKPFSVSIMGCLFLGHGCTLNLRVVFVTGELASQTCLLTAEIVVKGFTLYSE